LISVPTVTPFKFTTGIDSYVQKKSTTDISFPTITPFKIDGTDLKVKTTGLGDSDTLQFTDTINPNNSNFTLQKNTTDLTPQVAPKTGTVGFFQGLLQDLGFKTPAKTLTTDNLKTTITPGEDQMLTDGETPTDGILKVELSSDKKAIGIDEVVNITAKPVGTADQIKSIESITGRVGKKNGTKTNTVNMPE